MWVVICWADRGVIASTFGPFHDERAANRFAEFVRAEIDPATVERLADPITEVLNWRQAVQRDA